MTQLTIRQGEEKDLAAILRLDHKARLEPERNNLVREAVLDQRCWVAQAGGNIVGYGLVTHWFFGRSFLELVFIDKSHRCKGYGPALILFLEAHTKSSDLFTSTNQSNSHMQHVLEKLGYVESGLIHNLDPGDPEIVYVKKSLHP